MNLRAAALCSVALLVGLGSRAGSAANIKLITLDATATTASQAVSIDGEFVYSDIAAFEDIAAPLSRQTIVFISSPGGNLKAGIEIGRAIHRKGFRTAVADVCASACALAWLAGSQRFATDDSRIGFHVAYSGGVQKIESGMGNAIVGLYVGELGFRENVVTYITSAAPDDMQWLSFRDAALLGIDVDVLDVGLPGQPRLGSTLQIPSTASPSANTPEAAAVALIRDLVTSDMARGRDALTMVRNTYADWLNYYGKKSSFASVYADKQRYFERWPTRSYSIRESTLKASCDAKYCFVTGVYDWQVASTARKKSASGVASFGYVLERVADNLRVVSEEGEVFK
jgi:hypothetical protein